MLIGVIAFSFASGALASFLQSYDNQNATYKDKLATLNRIFHENQLPIELYKRLKDSLIVNREDNKEINIFLDELPHKLKLETSVCIYKNTIKSIRFLK